MKRIVFSCVAALLLMTGTASAALTVYEYVPDEKVTYDDATGNYWYWNLPDFTFMTYAQQITAIAGLGAYGGITGGWHMATLLEMQGLWLYSASDIADNFINAGPFLGYNRWDSRYDLASGLGTHYVAYLVQKIDTGEFTRFALDVLALPDEMSSVALTAWVTTEGGPAGAPPAVIPAPSALVLAATGVVSLLGSKRRRRKR